MTIAEDYARAVIKGTIPTNKLARLSCERFMADLKRKDLVFDKKEATDYTDFIGNEIHLWEDKWRDEKMEIFPYMGFIIQNIFGWKFAKTGRNRFRDSYIQTPKKQAKTTLMSGIAWAHMIIDKYCLTPQVIVGANNEEQAKICVNSCGKMVDVSPLLQQLETEGKIRRYQHGAGYFRITYQNQGRDGTIEGISKDPKTKAGRNPSLYIIDEYMNAEKDTLLKELHNAQMLRSDPRGIVITTPGFNKYVPCYQNLRKTSVDILEGRSKIDSRFSIIYEPDNEDDWDKKKKWKTYIPILKHVPEVADILEADFKTAKKEGGHSIVDFKTKNLGIWCDAATTWIEDEVFVQNNHGITDEELIGKECFAGFDLSKGVDLCCVGFLFPNIRPGIWAFKAHYWIPFDKIIESEDRVDYRKWADQGHLFVHTDESINQSQLADEAIHEMNKYDVQKIYIDPKYAYTGAINLIAERRYNGDASEVMIMVGQGNNLSSAIYEVESMLKHKNRPFDFLNNPVTRWCFSNVEIKENFKDERMLGKSDPRNKIDGATTLCTIMKGYRITEGTEEKKVAGLLWI